MTISEVRATAPPHRGQLTALRPAGRLPVRGADRSTEVYGRALLSRLAAGET